MHQVVSHLVKQHVQIATVIYVHLDLVMAARLAIWVTVGSCMKITHLGLMLELEEQSLDERVVREMIDVQSNS
jgi:hypothetical protein